MVVEVLVGGVDAQGGIGRDRGVGIAGQGEGAEAVERCGGTAEGHHRVGSLGHAVDRPAACAASEDQRIGALQHLDPLDIVERAIILGIVAQPVEIEIGGGFLTANEHFVAMAFAGLQADAGHETQGVAQLGNILVFQLVGGDRAHCLGHVDQWGRRACRAAAVIADIGIAGAGYDDVRPQVVALAVLFRMGRNGGRKDGYR